MKKLLLFLLSAIIVLLFYLLTLLIKGADRLFGNRSNTVRRSFPHLFYHKMIHAKNI